MRDRILGRGGIERPVAALLALLLCVFPSGLLFADDECDALIRETKLKLFDSDWDEVRRLAELLMAEHADCRHVPQAAYLRAQSLDRSGHIEEAVQAYADYLENHCPAAGGSINCNQARNASISALGRAYEETGRRPYATRLVEAMKWPGDSGVLAALEVAALDDPATRRRSLPRLLEAYDSISEPELLDRICLAVLKVDPGASPCTESKGARDTRDGGDRDDAGPSLISVEIFNKRSGRVELRINMPTSLAHAVINALPSSVHDQMKDEGLDVKQIFQAIREKSVGDIFRLETPDEKIRIWLQ